MKIRKKYWLITFIVFVIAGMAFFMLSSPLQNAATRQITKILGNYGINVKSMHVEHLDSGSALIKDVILIDDNGELKVKKIDAAFGLTGFFKLKLKTINIEEPVINVIQYANIVTVSGLEGFLKRVRNPELNIDNSRLIIPANLQQMALLPDNASITKGQLTFNAEALTLKTDYDLTFSKSFLTDVKANFKNIILTKAPYLVTADSISTDLRLDTEIEKWEGSTTINKIRVEGFSALPIPELVFESHITTTPNEADIQGHIRGASDKDCSCSIDFILNGDFKEKTKLLLNLSKAKIPFANGFIEMTDQKISILPKSDIRLKIKLNNIDVAEIASKFGDGKISGSGRLNGILPILITKNGNVFIEEGMATNGEGGGILKIEPSLIPASNPQVDLAKQMLQNFNYTSLKISVSSGADRSNIGLSVEGSNPDVLDGRAVKFNINFTGDVIEFIKQSLIGLSNPEELIKEAK